jgi:dTDP-4-dehydro-6-deoxy-alpha-D-glucopyranose 2,3-dehydratase
MDLKLYKWFDKQKKTNIIKVKIIDITKIKNWTHNQDSIFHNSKRFFKIIGVKVKTNFYKKNWDQPIILQKEVGILGILKNSKNDKYLLQAKVEPGNKNKIQFSPTVQATKSNYSQVHGGKKVPYLNYFKNLNKNFLYKQSEQGFRYFNKFNSNILMNIKSNISLKQGFIWVSLPELCRMAKRKNLLNMDTLSVISSNILHNITDNPLHKFYTIKKWIKNKDKTYFLKTLIVPLSKLKDWNYNGKAITHKNRKHFSIIGAEIKTNKREVDEWCQPILKGKNLAISGFLVKKFNKTNHYLCRYILKPGLKKSVLSCTVNSSDLKSYKKDNNLTSFQKKIITNYFLNNDLKENKIYDNIMSDEGGRFFHCQIRYIGFLLKNNSQIILPSNYIWVSHNQMINLIKDKKVDIEARLLFGSININKLK